MVTIVQENLKVYINKDQIKTLTFDEKASEAKVLFVDGIETKYLYVKSVRFN